MNKDQVKEALDSCKEAYATSMATLATLVASAIDTDVEPSLRIVWVRAGVEVVGMDDLAKVRAFIEKVDELTLDEDALIDAKFGAMMITTSMIMSQAAAMSKAVADLYGFTMKMGTMTDAGFASTEPPAKSLH